MNKKPAAPKGMVLIIAIVLLLILTIIAIGASSTASLQNRMAGNAQELNQIFQTAESGLARWTTLVENNPNLDLINSVSAKDSTWNALVLGAAQQNTAKIESIEHRLLVDCTAGSIGVDQPFEYFCFEVTSRASSTVIGGASVQHQMGYRIRRGK